MSIGIRVSKPTIDVTKAEKKDLLYDSDLNAFKIWKEGSGCDVGEIKVDHGLSFTPTFLAFAELTPDQVYPVNSEDYFLAGSDIYDINFNAHSTASQLVLNVSNTSFLIAGTFEPIKRNYYYYIFGDTAKEVVSKSELIKEKGDERFGIKISKVLKDASSTFIEDLLLTTDNPPLKLAKQGNATLTLPAAGYKTLEIPHEMPFIPAFYVLATADPSLGWSTLPMTVNGNEIRTYAYATPKSLVFAAGNIYGGMTMYLKYFIFAGRARA